MTGVTLEPAGIHNSPTGLVRYAIWNWVDADGWQRFPCDFIAALARAKAEKPPAGCGERNFRFTDKSGKLFVMMNRVGLCDHDGYLTEKGKVVRFAFRCRTGVKDGTETPHGLRRGCDIACA